MDVSEDDSGTSEDFEENVALMPASIARVVELARKHCTTRQWGEWLRVPLEHAAAEGDEQLAGELVLAGAHGDPISAALRGGHRDLGKHLLELDRFSTTLKDHHLRLAVELEDEVSVALFLGHGLRPQKDHLLRRAVGLGNQAIVSMLLNHGAHPDDSPDDFERDKEYATPLLMAAREGHTEMLRLLLDAGASAGRRLSTIVPAVECSHRFFRREAFRAKAESAMDLAAMGGHVGVIETIIERDSSLVNSVASSTGNTALLYAVKHHQLGAFDALVEAGADVEPANHDGSAAIHLAAGSPHNDAMLRTLLRRGAKVDRENLKGLTPLCLAVERGGRTAADMLLSAGADVNRSLLSASILEGKDKGTIRTLMEYGADVNTRGRDGNTPLHVAAQEGLEENVRVLIEVGGDETAVNDAGKTPAEEIGNGSDPSVKFFDVVDDIEALLSNAARDRACRLGFLLLLCRKYPGRVRLHGPLPENTDNEECSIGSAAGDCSVVSQAAKKATRKKEAGQESQLEETRKERASSPGLGEAKDSRDFTAVMDWLLSIQADEVFRKIVGFL